MRKRFVVVVPVLLMGVAACSPGMSSWDPLAVEPPRPELPAGFDGNDPYHLYRYGETLLERSPEEAAKAFYWASRLDPLWADPVYARRTALFMASPTMFYNYLYNRRRVADVPGVMRLDSLAQRALALNPFLQRKHDVLAIKRTILEQITREIRSSNPNLMVDENRLAYLLEVELRRADPEVRAWVAESEGRLPAALELYRTAVERDERNPALRTDLARVQFWLGSFADAKASFEAALELLRDRDEEDLVRYYESKVLLEHSIGLILEELGDVDAARSAYARALQEDMSYAPAHIRLGELALASGDTVTAIGEYALAAAASPLDPGVRYLHGVMLARAGRFEEAVSELSEATALEPHFAAPYLELAQALERLGRGAEAVAQYRAYLERASKGAPERSQAQARLAELEAAIAVEGEALR